MIGDPTAVLEWVHEVGPDGWGYDALLPAGPFVVGALAIFGRNAFTVGLALGYVVLFVAAFLYNGIE